MNKPEFDPNLPFQAAPGAPDQAPPQAASAPQSQDDAKPAFDPNQPFSAPEDQYGTGEQMAKTAAEQFASGATLGLSKVAETHLLGVKPEDIEGREKTNKITSTLSNIFGTGAGLAAAAATGGLSLGAEGAGLGVRAGIAAAEGAGIGGINQATDDWSQNKALDAQKIAASAGLGALIGVGGLGLGKAIGAAKSALTPLAKVAPKVAESAEAALDATSTGATDTPYPAGAIVDAPVAELKGVQPTNYQDIVNRVNEAKYSGNAIELPQKGELADAISRVEMANPVNPLQLDSLGNQTARDAYGTFKETPGEAGQALNNYEALQKNELTMKTGRAIQDIAPGSEPVSDAIKGGKTAIDAFTSQYQEEKAALKPVFEKLKTLPLNGNILPDAITKMTDAVPGIASMFDTTGAELGVKPYKTSWGIDKATYNAVKEATDSLRDAGNSFTDLWNIRKGMDQHIDVTAQGQAPAEIRSLKASLMDLLQESSPDENVRETFKRYAINEQQRQVIEKTFGASVGTPEFGAISKVKPEMIGDKIFGNSANVQAAKNILPPEQFNTILANWVAEAKAAATDKGAFSSNKFGSFLKRNQDALGVAFQDNPEKLQRLKDITTIARILPDAPSVNPSGTAKTLLRMATGVNLHDMTWEGMLASIPQKAVAKLEQRLQLNELNKALSGKAVENNATASLQKHVENTSQLLDTKIGALFPSLSSESRKALK